MRILIISAAVILGFGGLFVASKPDGSQAANTSTSSSIKSIQDDIAAGGQLLDVRTPEEYKAGHIDGAANLPLQIIQTGARPTVAQDKPVYVYCQSGNRSAQAKEILVSAGYTNIIDLGGMSEVQSLGGKVVN